MVSILKSKLQVKFFSCIDKCVDVKENINEWVWTFNCIHTGGYRSIIVKWPKSRLSYDQNMYWVRARTTCAFCRKPDFEDIVMLDYKPYCDANQKRKLQLQMMRKRSTTKYIKAIQKAIKKTPSFVRLDPSILTPRIYRDEMVRTAVNAVVKASDCYMVNAQNTLYATRSTTRH